MRSTMILNTNEARKIERNEFRRYAYFKLESIFRLLFIYTDVQNSGYFLLITAYPRRSRGLRSWKPPRERQSRDARS
jgi:hypothetical protein